MNKFGRLGNTTKEQRQEIVRLYFDEKLSYSKVSMRMGLDIQRIRYYVGEYKKALKDASDV